MKDRLIESFRELSDAVIDAAPEFLIGILLLIVGVIVAKIIEKILRMILVRLKFDSLVEKTGIDQTLQKIGIRQQLNLFVPRLVYFLLLFLLAKTVADALGLAAVSDAFSAFFAFLPNIIAALLLVILGTAAGSFAGGAVKNAAAEAGMDFAPALGRMVTGLILFVVGIMAISQLKIETEIIRIVTSFLMAGGALAFGLAFGLGTRDVMRHIVAGFYARRLLKIGQELEIAGVRGVVRAVTPTHTVLESDDQRTFNVANGKLLDEVARQ